MTTPRAALFRAIDSERAGRRAWIDAVASPLAAALGLAAMIFDTGVAPDSRWDTVLLSIAAATGVLFAAEFAARLWAAPEMRFPVTVSAWRARARYAASPQGLIDAAAVLALPVGMLLAPDMHDGLLAAAVWALKYLRHSTGLEFLIRVAARARAALFSVVTVFFVVFLAASTIAYFFERDSQPELFGSVPRAMWWAIVSLTTTGYGDAVPATVWGRLLAGWVMVSGVVVFALWAGIIANAYTEELRRRDFLRNWDLVSRVSFFQDLAAANIADIVSLLHPREMAAGTVLFRRGDSGDTMYFIVSGQVRVELGAHTTVLEAGNFVGEMALLFGTPRSATVVATAPSLLLALDIAHFRELAGRQPQLIDAIETEANGRREANLHHAA